MRIQGLRAKSDILFQRVFLASLPPGRLGAILFPFLPLYLREKILMFRAGSSSASQISCVTFNNSPQTYSPFCDGIETPRFIDSNPGIYCTAIASYSSYLSPDPFYASKKFNFHSSKTSSTRGARFLRLVAEVVI